MRDLTATALSKEPEVKEEPVVEEEKLPEPVFIEFNVGDEVTLKGVITNIMLDEIHVQLKENHRTYIFKRELFEQAQLETMASQGEQVEHSEPVE